LHTLYCKRFVRLRVLIKTHIRHIISRRGIEVDKAKVDLISNLPPPRTVKEVRSFLGHARFYRRFIQDFSKIARPLCKLLVKEAPFIFDEDCKNHLGP